MVIIFGGIDNLEKKCSEYNLIEIPSSLLGTLTPIITNGNRLRKKVSPLVLRVYWLIQRYRLERYYATIASPYFLHHKLKHYSSIIENETVKALKILEENGLIQIEPYNFGYGNILQIQLNRVDDYIIFEDKWFDLIENDLEFAVLCLSHRRFKKKESFNKEVISEVIDISKESANEILKKMIRKNIFFEQFGRVYPNHYYKGN